jgi:hypothetical protein
MLRSAAWRAEMKCRRKRGEKVTTVTVLQCDLRPGYHRDQDTNQDHGETLIRKTTGQENTTGRSQGCPVFYLGGARLLTSRGEEEKID